VPELAARGHDVVAVALPAADESAGFAEYADAFVAAIGNRTSLVLVAQSLAGFSAPLVCARRPVDLLVLLNAMIPRPNETSAEWWSNTGQQAARRDYLADIGLSPEAAEDEEVLYFHDVPADVVANTLRRGDLAQSMTPMSQPWPLTAWPDLPTRVVVGCDDRLFPAAFQQRVARERLGIEADEIDGGHLVVLSRPREVAERLETLRQDASRPR
jgi:hypothetical protein